MLLRIKQNIHVVKEVEVPLEFVDVAKLWYKSWITQDPLFMARYESHLLCGAFKAWLNEQNVLCQTEPDHRECIVSYMKITDKETEMNGKI